eukprot:IDg5168t1
MSRATATLPPAMRKKRRANFIASRYLSVKLCWHGVSALVRIVPPRKRSATLYAPCSTRGISPRQTPMRTPALSAVCAALHAQHAALHVATRASSGTAAALAALLAAAATAPAPSAVLAVLAAGAVLLAIAHFALVGVLHAAVARASAQCAPVLAKAAPVWSFVAAGAAAIAIAALLSMLCLCVAPHVGAVSRAPPWCSAELSEDEKDCAVCLENLRIQRACRLPCKHAFHLACILKWVTRRPVCPLCNASVHALAMDAAV